MWFIRAGAQSGSPNVSLRGSPEALRIEAEGKRNPPFPAGCQVGAPRFELGTSSPPDSSNELAAYLDTDDQLIFYCPECAECEFGEHPR